jgi:carboxyl-terminal processing protease
MRRPWIIAGSIAVLALAVGAGYWSRPARPAPTSVESESSFDRFIRVLRDRYVDSIDERELFGVASAAVLRHVGDPYGTLLTGPALATYRSRLTGERTGLGITPGVREGTATIIQVAAGSPAEEAGLRPGDRLMAIGGVTTDGLSPELLAARLDLDDDDAVPLVVRRGMETPPESLVVTRRELRIRAVATQGTLDDSTGFIALTSFSDGAAAEFLVAVDSLRAAGATRLIFDLRGNLGGRVREGVRVADLFLVDGALIAERQMRGAAPERFTAVGAERWPGLVVIVLVDASTASAAEIVAGALQGNGRARLVGRATYGKGESQEMFTLESGVALRITTGRWRTPGGVILARGKGLTPDLVTPLRPMAPAEARLRALLGERWPRFEGTLGRFVSGWAPGCPALDALPTLNDRATRRAFERALTTDSLPVRSIVYGEGRAVSDRLLGEAALREGCGEGGARLALALRDPDVGAALAP